MKGRAYAFVRKDGAPLPIACQGHVGWRFETDERMFFAGSTENSSGRFHVPAGGDTQW
jgi:hypothetical protein